MYRNYFEEVDELARSIFAEYAAAQDAYKKAKERRDSTPVKQYAAPDYIAKAARAAADYADADAAFKAIKKNMPGYTDKVDEIRRRLAAEVERDNMARPGDLDTAALELMRSGILTANEFMSLLDDARAKGNRTMQRLISKYAQEAGAKVAEQYGQGDTKAKEYRIVAAKGREASGDAVLEGFDVMRDAFRRTMSNTAMIGSWDSLTRRIWADL